MVQAQKLFLDIYFSYSDFYGGICMFSTISLAGFISFLSSAVFVVGYIQSSSLFPEPLSPSEEIEENTIPISDRKKYKYQFLNGQTTCVDDRIKY